MANQKIKSNIWKLYAMHAFNWFMVAMPIIVLFYQENGLNMKQIMILQAVFAIVVVFGEIPSGYLADIYGRKASLVFGMILGFLGYLVYSFTFGFTGFLVAEIVMGLGSSFISGADSAMLYDSLLDMGREGEYKKLEGRVSAVQGGSEAAAAILGGFAALVSLRFPVYLEAVAMFLAIPFTLALKEPAKKSFLDNTEGNIRAILKIVRFSLHEQLEVKWLIIYGAFLGASTMTMVWFVQPILKQGGLPLIFFGAAWAVLNLSYGLFSVWAYRIENFWGRRKTLVILILLTVLGFVFLSIFGKYLWAAVFIIIFYFVRGLNIPLIKDYLNRLVSSEIRATVLSVRALMARLVFAVTSPFLGWASDAYSLNYALALSSLLFAIFGGVSLFYLHKYKAL